MYTNPVVTKHSDTQHFSEKRYISLIGIKVRKKRRAPGGRLPYVWTHSHNDAMLAVINKVKCFWQKRLADFPSQSAPDRRHIQCSLLRLRSWAKDVFESLFSCVDVLDNLHQVCGGTQTFILCSPPALHRYYLITCMHALLSSNS